MSRNFLQKQNLRPHDVFEVTVAEKNHLAPQGKKKKLHSPQPKTHRKIVFVRDGEIPSDSGNYHKIGRIEDSSIVSLTGIISEQYHVLVHVHHGHTHIAGHGLPVHTEVISPDEYHHRPKQLLSNFIR